MKRTLFILFFLICSINGYGQSTNLLERQALRAIQFEKATDWIIEEGVSIPDDRVLRKIMKENFNINNVTTSSFDANDQEPRTRTLIKSPSIAHNIIRVHSEQFEEGLIEYWVVFRGTDRLSRSCEFIITSSKDVYSKRLFLTRETAFFISYSLNDHEVFELPINNLSILLTLRAWVRPACFEDNDISDYYIERDEDGELKKVKLSLWDKFTGRLFRIR